MEIQSVRPGSIAEREGFRPGDRVVGINGRAVRDTVDYLFLRSEERMKMEVESPDGRRRTVRVKKTADQDLGLQPAPDEVRRCGNRCVFCFVDQLPEGLRPTLYVKDEDYRLSFLHGSYVTLTNLGPDDWERIGEQRLSPLYVSVHATEPELRARILGNPRSGDILGPLRRLAEMRITVHAQIVLCPGINDGVHLARTVDDLLAFHPWVESVAVVPVGLTGHRRGLARITPFTEQGARDLIAEVRPWQARYLERLGTRGVFLADEFYIRAGEPLPPVSEFESLAQVENGVGMTSAFLAELEEAFSTVPSRRLRDLDATLVTGTLMGAILDDVLARRVRDLGGRCRVLPVPNRWLGESVTVSGLLSGRDISEALSETPAGTRVFLPPACVNEDGLLLDNLRPEDLARRTGLEIRVASPGAASFLRELAGTAGV